MRPSREQEPCQCLLVGPWTARTGARVQQGREDHGQRSTPSVLSQLDSRALKVRGLPHVVAFYLAQ